MLHEKTTSANNLRIQSSRRHHIRNLRAKVRSMLPEQICPKQRKHANKVQIFQQALNKSHKTGRSSQVYQGDKKLMKELQKLSLLELQEISENKYYFFGNETAIEQYDLFIKEYHPEIKRNQWTSPNINKKLSMPFGFIPPFLSTQKENGSRLSITSEKKRGSASNSILMFTNDKTIKRQTKSEYKNYKQKDSNLVSRKQAIDEQLKVKRQISSVHLQRQQHIADVNRSSLLKLKMQKAKIRHYANSLIKNRVFQDQKTLYQQYDVTNLTAKLRKICLKRNKINEEIAK